MKLLVLVKLLVLALSLASARGFGYLPEACTSAGSCYSATDHTVTCDVPEDDCQEYWFEPGFVGSYNGCCHCECSCDHALETATDSCSDQYYD